MNARRRQALALLGGGLALIVLMPQLLHWLSPLGVLLVVLGLYRWVTSEAPGE